MIKINYNFTLKVLRKIKINKFMNICKIKDDKINIILK